MTIAEQYCNASIAFDRANASAGWNKSLGVTSRQRDAYLDREIGARDKLLAKYPHKYVAAKSSTNTYDVKQVFEDGSEVECLPMLVTELQWLRDDGKQVEIVE